MSTNSATDKGRIRRAIGLTMLLAVALLLRSQQPPSIGPHEPSTKKGRPWFRDMGLLVAFSSVIILGAWLDRLEN